MKINYQEQSMPVTKNMEVISCQYCPNETVVMQKDHVVRYTCPTCYNVPKLKK